MFDRALLHWLNNEVRDVPCYLCGLVTSNATGDNDLVAAGCCWLTLNERIPIECFLLRGDCLTPRIDPVFNKGFNRLHHIIPLTGLSNFIHSVENHYHAP